MAAETQPDNAPRPSTIDWEAFYTNYRKPGYVPGFEIVNKLGGGVFGMVFKARKESIGKDYAIKFLKVDDEPVRDAVVREIDSVRFFAQVDHPNLVSIEDKGEIDGIPFIVMSFAGQETLRKRLDEQRLDRDAALRVFIQAARGVQALHEHSLVHFDLKPANIFLKGDIARVGDYGLSKLVTESRNSLSFGRGTPYYMAPEMLQRRGDARSDVYSLGVILFECLTGDVPFRGDSEWEVLRKHEVEPPRFPDYVARIERSVIARALAKDPDDRFQTVAEMLHALEAPASLGESLVIPPAVAMSAPAPAEPAAPSAAPIDEPEPQHVSEPPPIPDPVDPWTEAHDDPPRGPIGAVVHVLFRVFEFAVLLVLVPIRALAEGLGRLLVFLFQLPFRVLGVALTLAGYLIVALATLMVLVGVRRAGVSTMDRNPEIPTIEELQAMDEGAWQRLQDGYFRRVYFFVRRYIENHQTAEDLTQDVFLGAVKGIERFDKEYTLDQFLFGIAKNRVIDWFRKHRMPLIPAKSDGDSERSAIWLENMAESKAIEPGAEVLQVELKGRQRAVLGQILREFVAQLWAEGEFKKLMILEYLFVLGGRNKHAAERFDIADEKAIAGIKFRAIEKLRGLARQSDPNHSIFRGLWQPGAR